MSECLSCMDVGGVGLFFTAHRWIEKGYLPLPGSWPDQPNKLIQAHDLIGTLIRRYSELETQSRNVNISVVERKIGERRGK